MTHMQELGYDFENNPIEYTFGLIDESIVTEEQMISMCLKFMSHANIRQMLDDNELSPRFF
jgi:hypothetical protein